MLGGAFWKDLLFWKKIWHDSFAPLPFTLLATWNKDVMPGGSSHLVTVRQQYEDAYKHPPKLVD